MIINLNILVIGASRSGKSSLIAAMMSKLQQMDNLRVYATDDMGAERRLLLNRCGDIFSPENIRRGDWLDDGRASTQYISTHAFSLHVGAGINLKITEVPGSILEHDVTPIIDLVRQHEVVFVTIDTPVLMEGGFSSSNRNHIGTITDLLIGQWGDIAQNETQNGKPLTERRVMLIPLKSEKYIQMDSIHGKQEINAKIKAKFAELLEYVHVQSHIKAYIVHAQTLGDLVFDHWGEGAPLTRKEHYAYLPNAKYNPHDCEQPLLYAMDFAIKNHKWPTPEEAVRFDNILYKTLDIISNLD